MSDVDSFAHAILPTRIVDIEPQNVDVNYSAIDERRRTDSFADLYFVIQCQISKMIKNNVDRTQRGLALADRIATRPCRTVTGFVPVVPVVAPVRSGATTEGITNSLPLPSPLFGITF